MTCRVEGEKIMRIVAAPNAFKGSIGAVEAAKAMKKGILAALPDCIVDCVPVSDGGDGLTEVLAHALCGEILTQKVCGPLMKEVSSAFCFVKSKNLAVVEMAKASGLALITPEMYNPMKTTTFGTGELIGAALDTDVKKIVVGIGIKCIVINVVYQLITDVLNYIPIYIGLVSIIIGITLTEGLHHRLVNWIKYFSWPYQQIVDKNDNQNSIRIES